MSWQPVIHYPGDVAESVLSDPDRVYGPGEPPLEESFVATAAEYDPDADRTTVTLKPITRQDAIERSVRHYGEDLEQLKRLARAGLLSGAVE